MSNVVTVIFDIENEVLVLNENALTIPELVQIKETYPEYYMDVFKYVWRFTLPDHTKNPYWNYKEDRRRSVLEKDFITQHGLTGQDPLIVAAIDKLTDMFNEDPVIKFGRAHKQGMDDISNYFIDNSGGVSGWDKDKILAAKAFLSDAGKMVEQYMKTTEAVQKRTSKNSGAEIPYDFR